MSADEHYRALVQRAAESVESLVGDVEPFTTFVAVHNVADEIEKVVSAVAERPEAVLYKLALREYNYALYAASSGSYRHAHIGLRMFLELFSAGIYFSAYEIKLRSWLSGFDGSDINWAALSNSDTGIYSTSFVNAFNPAISSSAKQYRTIATATYRECSEFVHGNIHTQDLSFPPLSYKRESLQEWIDRAEAANLCVLFSFASRYLALLSKDQLAQVEAPMIDRLGHIAAVQQIYT